MFSSGGIYKERQPGAPSPGSLLYGMTKQLIENQTMDQERALYNVSGALVKNCTFAGEADGESALKECRDVEVEGCRFLLRYPLWHTTRFTMKDCQSTDTARAALWYAEEGEIRSCQLNGVKALRECRSILLENCRINSTEFGWNCTGVTVRGGELESEYVFMGSRDLSIRDLRFKGKYSFQYVRNARIEHSVLDTKDAFWHCSDVMVRNCVIKGEYLAWYSENLTLENCRIIGTQPFCYCKNLRLINCTMEDADLAFECSSVEADVRGRILSVKNPMYGSIVADRIDEVIIENPVRPTECRVTVRSAAEA